MRRTSLYLIAAVTVAALVASAALATQIIYRTPRELGEQSSIVASGTVSGVRSYWNDEKTKIFTETTISVDETFKGRPVPSVRVIQLGGTVGTVKVTVHGALQWREGEEVLVFLTPHEGGRYQVSGFSQGKFGIERDPQTGKTFVTRGAIRGAEVLGAPGREGAAPVTAGMRVPLEQFIADALGRR